MRVVSGDYKGRRLLCPAGSVRPTTDKVKEAMFGALQFDLPGAFVLDAFAGSGALGIEALSRGAAHADFAEKNSGCLRILRENINKTVSDDKYDIYRGDVIKLMPQLKTYDIMLLDPPYDDGLYAPALEGAHAHGILKDGCRVVMECRRKFDFQLPKEYNLTKRKDYGDISLWYLVYGEQHD